MEIHWKGTGPPELHREDGWIYRLHGIGQMNVEIGFDRAVLYVVLYDLSDRALDSIRVIRDYFPDYSIHLEHDNY
jgi:hypothetical protein